MVNELDVVSTLVCAHGCGGGLTVAGSSSKSILLSFVGDELVCRFF
jgi:hypothetical protein